MIEIHPRVVEYYVDGRGRRPFTEWLDVLKDIRARACIRLRVDRLKLGNLGDYRFVGEGVFELKIDFGPGYRVYFSFMENQNILLLYGGDKSSQERDIQKAKEYLIEHQRRQYAYTYERRN